MGDTPPAEDVHLGHIKRWPSLQKLGGIMRPSESGDLLFMKVQSPCVRVYVDLNTRL